MLARSDQYVNIHAHRVAQRPDEWVLTNLDTLEYNKNERSPGAFYSVGLHPWAIDKVDNEDAIAIIQGAVKNKQVIAIGEAGLDKAISTPLDKQMGVFERQVGIAEQAKLPIIIHSVRTTQEILLFKKVHSPIVPLIVHGFRGGMQQAESLFTAGFFLSVGQTLLLSDQLKQVVKELPLDNLFIETDDFEVLIIDLYKTVAEIRKISVADLQKHMLEKIDRIFNKPNR